MSVRSLVLALLLSPVWGVSSAQGIRYEHRVQAGPVSLHILEADPRELEIRAVRALNDGLGRETVSSIAKRSGAKAAINGGFFTIGSRLDGLPTGILKIDGVWYGDSRHPRAALGWNPNGKAIFGRLRIEWWLSLDGTRLPVDGLNRLRGPTGAVLYNWAFHRTTLTDPGGREYHIREREIVEVSGNDSPIPVDGWVYSLGAGRRLEDPRLRKGSEVNLSVRHLPFRDHRPDPGDAEDGGNPPPDWESMDTIVQGAGLLVLDEQRLEDFGPEVLLDSFIEGRHPRTAVGIRKDGVWVIVVVDGRFPTVSVGMTLDELSRLMLSMGCRDALNLDGGGSSTLFWDGEVRNRPSDLGKERPVSDAIVFLEKTTSR